MANTPQTKFRIGSITKQFTAACIMVLTEQGKLKVEDRVSKFLAGMPSGWNEITIHQLLIHSAGLFNVTALLDHRLNQALPSSPLNKVARIRDRPLEFEPGTQFKYSNKGYIALGIVVERASGTSYEKFLNENLFEPLEMTSTGYDHAPPIIANRAAGCIRAQSVNWPGIRTSRRR